MLKKEKKMIYFEYEKDFKFYFLKMRKLIIKIERNFIGDCFNLSMNNDFECWLFGKIFLCFLKILNLNCLKIKT